MEEKTFNNVCTPNCTQGCRITTHVRGGRLVKVSMNPMPEEVYNRVCLRGLSSVQQVYHPDRLKYPLRRVGARGKGNWKRISWDEALDTIASRLAGIRDRYGSRAVAFIGISGNYGLLNGAAGMWARLANVFQGTAVSGGIDSGVPLGIAQVLGGGDAGNEPMDIANSKLAILWGSNLTETAIHHWHFVADMKEKGGKLVVIDPNFIVAASKADKWIRVRPGSDPALGLSILNVLIEEGLYDREFVCRHTVAPFLVREQDGLFLRENAVVRGGSEKYMVWDPATGSARPFDQVQEPALDGRYAVAQAEGVTLRPAFALLRERVRAWEPEKAREYTGVEPHEVRWLAREYAATRQSTICYGMGTDRYANSHQVGRAIATMAALTGNLGTPGASAAGFYGGPPGYYFLRRSEAYRSFVRPSGTAARGMNPLLLYDAIAGGTVRMHVAADRDEPGKGTMSPDPVKVPWVIKAAVINNGNWVGSLPHQNRMIHELFDERNLEFVVCADMFMTDTARVADLVLPVAHWFETDDLVGAFHPFLLRQEKALDPPPEAKSDFDIVRLLGRKLGFEQYFQGEPRDYIDQLVAGMGRSLGERGDKFVAELRETGAARISPAPGISFRDLNFRTPSRRIEFYAEAVRLNFPHGLAVSVAQGADPLPQWESPHEAWEGTPEARKFPLRCFQEHSRWRVHSSFFNRPWLRERDREPCVEINSKDAAARMIRHNDYVEVFNDRGSVVLRAKVSGRIQPGMINIPKGWQNHQTARGSYQSLSRDHRHPVNLNASFFDTMVDVRRIEIPEAERGSGPRRAS